METQAAIDDHEQTGEKFNRQRYFQAAELCKMIVHQISEKVEVGMNEAQCQKILKDEFKKNGIKKFWHPSKFRIAADTLKNFGEAPDQSLTLQNGELYSIDVGPVIDDHEADFGQSYLLNPHLTASEDLVRLNRDAVLVWNETAKKWRQDHLSGRRLYEYCQTYARSLGYELNPSMAGHRLGDFPHALFSKKKLAHYSDVPTSDLWVLEVHLLSEKCQRASFFEDILSDPRL